MPHYADEREGQKAFYQVFIPRIDPKLSLDDILADDNDGVINGNLLEFKLSISDLNAVLFQTIKYLSARRVKGKAVPANILLVSLNDEIAYLYHSQDYLDEIEKVYSGGASKGNKGFAGGQYHQKFHYGNDMFDADNLVIILKQSNWIRIHIDENCIVGWAERFYREVPGSRKEDFIGDDTGKHKTIGEIRNPTQFKDYIFPYQGKNNTKFQYLMDKLNDTIQKKNLGAFYTPTAYAEKAHELLRKAIERVPQDNDYVIIDRCAGTGNLEKGLTDEELSHCICSTVEYYEYKVLQELLGDKLRHIIPPIETDDTFNGGLVRGADALSEEYVNNPIIRQYVDNPACTIILFENPPYAETTSVEHQRKGKSKASSTWKNSYVVQEMKKTVKGTASNDLGNAFIWSGFEYYLRQPTDSYVVFSPVKYWKVHHLIDKQFGGGYAFNRRWFHTNIDACIMVALWYAVSADIECLLIDGYDIDKQSGVLVPAGKLPVKRINSTVSSKYYDKRPIADSDRNGILCGLNGLEKVGGVQRNKPACSLNILGYMVTHSTGFDNPDLDSSLLVSGRYDGNGFYLRKDNYLSKMPLFCMSRYITYNREWTERARIMKSADGAERFNADVASGKLDQWLLKCLLFTCFEMQNHMRSFTGSDGHYYRNELCLDTTNGDTVASIDIARLEQDKSEAKLMAQWKLLLEHVKTTPDYNCELTYGVYQIFAEIDTWHYDEETGEKVYNNLEVHSDLQTLKQLLKTYYNSEIVPTLFKYEFLK